MTAPAPIVVVRPDFHIRADLRLLVDNRGFVNFHRTPASLKLKIRRPPLLGAPMIM